MPAIRTTPQIVPHVAESSTANDDASVWTFKIREGMAFSDGEEILPSTFQRSWERAADLAGDYSYLLGFIEGGAERLDRRGRCHRAGRHRSRRREP